MVVVKLQQFTECERSGYNLRRCDTTELFEIMSLYLAQKTYCDERFVHFAVTSKHTRSKVTRFYIILGY